MLDVVVTAAAEGNQVGILVQPALTHRDNMMHIELDPMDGVQLFAGPMALDAALAIQLVDVAAAQAADAGGVVGTAPAIVGVLGPHRADDLGAAAVKSPPAPFQDAGPDLDRPAAQFTGAFDQGFGHMRDRRKKGAGYKAQRGAGPIGKDY
jgi:hypothetical protein